MFLTVTEVADGGAVLAAGGVVDLPSVPPWLSGNGLLHGGPGIHRLSGRTLGSADRRSHQDGKVSISRRWETDSRQRLGLLHRFPGQRDCALERWRVVEQILNQTQKELSLTAAGFTRVRAERVSP